MEFEDDFDDKPRKKPDPFFALMDAAMVGAADTSALDESENYQVHSWETYRERFYSGEVYKFRCGRCHKFVDVNPEAEFETDEVESYYDEEEEVCDTNGNPVLDANGDPTFTVTKVPVFKMAKRGRSIEEAMRDQGIDPDCAMVLITETIDE